MISNAFAKDFSSRIAYMPQSFSLLCFSSLEDSQASITTASKIFEKSRSGKTIIITFNTTYKKMKSTFDENRINNKKFTVIACNDVSKVNEKSDCCIVLRDPSSLNDLSLIITRLCKQRRYRYILLDSVNSLLYYNKENSARRFVQFLLESIKEYEMSGILFANKDDMSKSIVDFVESRVDGKISVKRCVDSERFADAFG